MTFRPLRFPVVCSRHLVCSVFFAVSVLLAFSGCDGGGSGGGSPTPVEAEPLVVNSLQDVEDPADEEMTLRAALQQVPAGGTIIFDPALNGCTIELVLVGEENSVLKGELFEQGRFAGYQERNYGPSALYARKSVTIDASDLPDGIRLEWTGGAAEPARVLAVYGDLTLRNVTITGGYSVGLEIYDDPVQPYTLARGGGVAVWGHAVLQDCTIFGNTLIGDIDPGRDRGAFGGGVYADLLTVRDSVVSGNRVSGYGAAGGGVYTVGGAGFTYGDTTICRTAVTGNRISGLHTYGGGIYSDGGGRGKAKKLILENCTVARNVVEHNVSIEIPETLEPWFQFYFRGGGVYMSNGSMWLTSCTIAENDVTGRAHVFNNKPNMGGGGIAATIGNAHDVEEIRLRHSIVVGNTLNGVSEDVFTGSLMHFYSQGYNLVGNIDFNQILVPVPYWNSLSRRHWPKEGDHAGAAPENVLANVVRHDSILSAGTDEGDYAILWYEVKGGALDVIPNEIYVVRHVHGQKRSSLFDEISYDTLQADILESLANRLGEAFQPNIGEDLINADFYPEPEIWPTLPENANWIEFWRELDIAVGDQLGEAGIADAFWEDFIDSKAYLQKSIYSDTVYLISDDQRGVSRPEYYYGDIGAVEVGGL
ncbi:MAG: hypothetical protein R6U50_04235 [Desulfobacterales bacterium]